MVRLNGVEARERDPGMTRERLQQELTWGVATLLAGPLCLVLPTFVLPALFVEAFIDLFVDQPLRPERAPLPAVSEAHGSPFLARQPLFHKIEEARPFLVSKSPSSSCSFLPCAGAWESSSRLQLV